MSQITIAYTDADRALAERVAADLEAHNYTLGTTARDGVLLAVISARALDDADFMQEVHAAQDASAHIVLLATDAVNLPPTLDHLTPVSLANGYRWNAVRQAVDAAQAVEGQPIRVRTPSVRSRNLWWGLGIGFGLLALFGFYTWAIVVFDIEAPAEDFQRAYTRSAATVNAFAQPFIPRTTEQAQNFELTLESNAISNELATVVVGTATQAAADGGFTPIPTGQIVAPDELSIVRQTATGGAILRATQTAAADVDTIAATATQAAREADTELQNSLQTVTAAATD